MNNGLTNESQAELQVRALRTIIECSRNLKARRYPADCPANELPVELRGYLFKRMVSFRETPTFHPLRNQLCAERFISSILERLVFPNGDCKISRLYVIRGSYKSKEPPKDLYYEVEVDGKILIGGGPNHSPTEGGRWQELMEEVFEIFAASHRVRINREEVFLLEPPFPVAVVSPIPRSAAKP